MRTNNKKRKNEQHPKSFNRWLFHSHILKRITALMANNNLKQLEKTVGITFKNKDLLTMAVVHRSYLNENPSFKLDHNERLEFLGDAVIEIIVTDHLFHNYPNPEGDLTNWRSSLVNSKMLSTIAHDLKVDEFLFLSKGETKDINAKSRQYILANAFEAIVGAIYLDQGYDTVQKFVTQKLLVKLPEIIEQKLYIDPKSRFQELAQEKMSITPSYKVLDESGPDHDKHFVVGIYLGNELVAQGEGKSKQEGQVQAAAQALAEKGWE